MGVPTVTIPAAMSSDGTQHIYTGDADPITGITGGMHTVNLLPMFIDMVSVASYVVTTAGGVAQNATNAAESAATSASNAAASQDAAATSVAQVNTLGAATGLQTTGAVVVVNGASPPIVGEVLMAKSATTASWEFIPEQLFPNSYFSINGVI